MRCAPTTLLIGSGGVNSVTEQTTRKRSKREGMPVWLPFVGLLVAFLFAVYAGARICPTLSALVLPPEPPLPDGRMTRLLHENKGVGLDEYVYGTGLSGCRVAEYYEERLEQCFYDPGMSCRNGEPVSMPDVSEQHVARCTGRQSIDAYSVFWTVYISTNYGDENVTRFRVIREVGN